ncbi:MAG: DNA replication/repair protein RecF [Enterococcaceae bacterium]|jgi:DNA replication and repair protein RecF|nr:DNA replication/repair protein RecF [Enterococcaceae bacterium]
MRLNQLTLQNFRNYSELQLEFSPGLNLFLGPNAQGKTNLLEAINVLAMTKSHRTSQERSLIQWGKDFARVTGEVQKENQKYQLEVLLTKKGRKVKVNHLEQRRLSDYIGHLNVILFSPEDLSLIKGGPANRRRFLDMEIGQTDVRYLYESVQYQKILRQRNHFLKQAQAGKRADLLFLDVLSEQLAVAGAVMVVRRLAFLQQLGTLAEQIHTKVTGQKEELAFAYQSSLGTALTGADQEAIKGMLLTQLKEKTPAELIRGTTLAGPHRDDFLFLINGQNVQTYGSQGQQRTAILSIKLAEIEWIKEQVGEYPILLLDDVMSELDHARQFQLLETIEGKVQTFLTTTELDYLTPYLTVTPKIFRMNQGKVESEREEIDRRES